jgi:hypothetical protein
VPDFAAYTSNYIPTRSAAKAIKGRPLECVEICELRGKGRTLPETLDSTLTFRG